MFNNIKLVILAGVLALTAACASTPVTTSSNHTTADGIIDSHSLRVRAGGDQQLITIVWDHRINGYALTAVSQNETFIRAVLESVVANWGTAIISGVAGINIAQEGSCGEGGNCGTVIWNNGTSSAISGSTSGSVSVAEATASS